MAQSVDWDALYADYLARLPVRPFPLPVTLTDEIASMHAPILAEPTPDDVAWLSKALADAQGKWFVAGYIESAASLAEPLFTPILNAACNADPSRSQIFVEPCVLVFGVRRVNEYLLELIEHGTADEIAGALEALYWAVVPSELWTESPNYRKRAKYQKPGNLDDLWQKRRTLLLRTFIFNTDISVRQRLISFLNLNEALYGVADRALVRKAISIARRHSDEYIRQRLAVQLGESRLFPMLPPRNKH